MGRGRADQAIERLRAQCPAIDEDLRERPGAVGSPVAYRLGERLAIDQTQAVGDEAHQRGVVSGAIGGQVVAPVTSPAP